MGERKNSGTAMFLMEMIMVVGFFIICACICIQVFARANTLSRLAEDTNHAVIAAENMAESWKAGERSGTESTEPQYFDRNWQEPADPSQAAFAAELQTEDGDGMQEARITVTRLRDQRELIQIRVGRLSGGKG